MTLPRSLTEAERLDWLRLARTQNVGPVTFAALIRRFGTASAALEALPEVAHRSARGKPVIIPDTAIIEQELAAASRYGAQILASCEPDFPALLHTLDPPPPVLTLLGNPALAAEPACAIVGARNASAAGRKIAREMAAALGKAGFVIASGLALGIDGEAHAASLPTGTIAVLGGGIDHIYPGQHDGLYAAIRERGLIVSEMPFGHRAKAQDFPRRNRIITGLARGTVVIEAAERSGSLISARVANEQGREVMAVPGSPLDPRAAGTNNLIRQGAALVRHAEDVLEILTTLPLFGVAAPSAAWFGTGPESSSGMEDTPSASETERVRRALTAHAMPLDEIARASGLPVARAGAILMELELCGEAETFPGGLAARRY